MFFDGKLKIIGHVDVFPLQVLLEKYSQEDWQKYDYRQKQFEVHKQTQTIAIKFPEHDKLIYNNELWQDWKLLLKDFYEQLAVFYKLPSVNFESLMFAEMLPGAKIASHKDIDPRFKNANRTIYPLKATPGLSLR